MSVDPKVVLIGARGIGKSSFISSITGISLGITTTSAIEWHLAPSSTWSATVSVAFYLPLESASGNFSLTTSAPQQVGEVCLSREQLQQELKKAALLVYYPAFDWQQVPYLDKSTVDGALESLSESVSTGVIYVDLRGLHNISKDITIVDLPGIMKCDCSEVVNPVKLAFSKQLIKSYAVGEATILSVMLPFHEFENVEDGSGIIAFVRSIQSDMARINVVYNRTAQFKFSMMSLESRRPYRYFFIQGTSRDGPYALSDQEVQSLWEQENSFFHICLPWATLSDADHLGVGRVLEAWSSQSERLRMYDAHRYPPLAVAKREKLLTWSTAWFARNKCSG